MQKYKVVFFDLDHTLWDYDRNSAETLRELYHSYNLYELGGVSLTNFLHHFDKVNNSLWDQYNKGQISRDIIRAERFKRILKSMDIEAPEEALQMSKDYISLCPQKTNLLPHAHEVLAHLKLKYELYILTNGFNDVQKIKIKKSNLEHYFKGMITSEQAGFKKPSIEMFQYALQSANCSSDESIMIGDNLKTDISGALNAQMDAVFFNPYGHKHRHDPHYEITSLSELTIIL